MRPDLRAELVRFLRRRRRLLVALGVVLVVLFAVAGRRGADEGSYEGSLAAVLREDGLTVDPASVVFLDDGPSGLFGTREAVFIASRPSEAEDLWYATVRPGDDGELHDVSDVTNLTRTSSAAELPPVRAGDFVMYASRIGDRFDAVTLLDARGEPESLTADWPARARAQNAITNVQETGRSEGFGRLRYNLLPEAESLALSTREGRFVVQADGGRIVIDPREAEPVEGADHVELRPTAKGMPGTITWVVDTVRNVSFIGPGPIEWLEHEVFAVKDAAERAYYAVFGSAPEGAEVAEDMGVSAAERRRRLALSAPDPELGWPPPPLEPVLDERVDGEGEWIPVVDDPFVKEWPGAPPAFYQSFVRADPERAYTRVYVTVWDPRQVQLHVMTGTREPESATGETGPGRAPRDARTLSRLVAGFNGGFQALHGEFGMMAEDRVYLPPKPWAATVAVYDDGRVAMGSWPGPPPGVHEYDERWAVEQIPDHVVALRQNLTSVVEDGRYNPWERWWWGAAPLDADEQVHIDRSGLCLTREGYLAYFWGQSLGPDALGAAMLATRCVRGMHLDMNSRHTGFEFYNIAPSGEPLLPPLGREPTEDEYVGPTPDAPGYTLRARKMVRSMTPMRFPRYVGTDPRDFFYLTLRPILPGPPIDHAGGSEGAGVYDTRGLPHAGFPHAFARAFLGGDHGERTWLVRVDVSRAPPSTLAPEGAGRPLAYLTNVPPSDGAGFALYAERGLIGWQLGVGRPPEGARIVVAGPPISSAPDAGAAVAVDPEGFLLYAERQPGDHASLAQRLRAAGVTDAVALSDGARLAFRLSSGDLVAPDAFEREVPIEGALAFVADERPRTEVMFPDVEPMPYRFWRRLQDARVRYVREGPPRFIRGSDGEVIQQLDAGTP